MATCEGFLESEIRAYDILEGPKYLFTGMSRSLNVFNPFTPKSAKLKTKGKILNFILQNYQKQTVPHGSTAQ